MKKALIVLLVILGLIMLGTTRSTAAQLRHTPSGGADCSHVWAQGTSYEAGDTNTLTVSVDGDTDTVDFATDGYLDMAIPNDGVEHTWSWAVDTTNPDPAYSDSGSGTITCGDRPVTRIAVVRVGKYDSCAWQADLVYFTLRRHVHGAHIAQPTHTRWVVTAKADTGYVLHKFRHGGPLVKRIRWVLHTRNQQPCDGGGSQ
jgi:hypothetical protein